jgi:PKD repeat protein
VVYPKPALSFTSSLNQVCAGDTISFFNTSSDALSSIFWDFGFNGATSGATNPTYVYPVAGTYTVTLIGVGAAFACPDTIQQTVTVIGLPDAQISLTPATGCQPLIVNFSNLSSGASGYIWYFGDNNISTLSSPMHLYLDSGFFEVSLIAINVFGCTDTAFSNVVVYPKPVANFDFTPPFSCNSPVYVQMQNLSTNPTGSLWNFGVQGTSTFIDPSITYLTPGSYPIELQVINPFGCRDTIVKIYDVYPTPEALPIIAQPIACVGEPIPFSHASQNGVYYQWSFGNGDTTNTQNPFYAFTSPGVYSVQLVVTGPGGCTDTAMVQNAISVLTTPAASFNYVKDPDTYNYGLVHFSNSSTGGSSYLWDFGDGTTSPLISPSHQYQNYGEYIVTLIVTNANGCADTAIQIIYVDYFKGLFVPNALSPEDGPEDVRHFLPKGRGLKKYRLEIFDAWGNLLWYSEKLQDGIPAEGWLGTRMDNGVLLPQDVYVWKIRAEFLDGSLWEGQDRSDGRKRLTGTITLIR